MTGTLLCVGRLYIIIGKDVLQKTNFQFKARLIDLVVQMGRTGHPNRIKREKVRRSLRCDLCFIMSNMRRDLVYNSQLFNCEV